MINILELSDNVCTLKRYVNPWLIHVNVWQKPLQYCKVISLQLIKINGEKKRCLSEPTIWASQVALVVKNAPANVRDLTDRSWIHGSGRSPGGRNGNPLQYSCLENPMDTGA